MKRTGMINIKDILRHRHGLGLARPETATAVGVSSKPPKRAAVYAAKLIRRSSFQYQGRSSTVRSGAPSSGQSRKLWILSSISPHSLETWLLEMPDMPMACTRSSGLID